MIEEDPRSSQEILQAIFAKCKETLPQISILLHRFKKEQNINHLKIRKKDCLNPEFLIQLSNCGEEIKKVLQGAIESQQLSKEALKMYFRKYMKVIQAIKMYHIKAHLSHDLHKNSTQMKENLLNQLKAQMIRRKQLQIEVQVLRKELAEKDSKNADPQSRINISQISQISKKVGTNFGQLYGGDSRVGQIDEDEQALQGKRLRKYILQLQQQLQQKKIQLEQQKALWKQQIQQQQMQINEFQKKFQEYYSKSSRGSSKAENFKDFKNFNQKNKEPSEDINQFLRMLLLQSLTIEQYLKNPEDD